MTKVHADVLISCHVVDCRKLNINWFVVKFCPCISTQYIRSQSKDMDYGHKKKSWCAIIFSGRWCKSFTSNWKIERFVQVIPFFTTSWKKSLGINMLNTCNSIGEIVSISKKTCLFLSLHIENILLRINKILKNYPYVKS